MNRLYIYISIFSIFYFYFLYEIFLDKKEIIDMIHSKINFELKYFNKLFKI